MLSRRQFGMGVAAAGIAAPHVLRAQAPIRLRLAHAANEVHPGHIAAVKFKEALDKLIPGRVNLQIFQTGSLVTTSRTSKPPSPARSTFADPRACSSRSSPDGQR